MTTWEEIRDEIAGMLADGQPLEDVIAKLEKQKNEMAKANLIAVMDEMKKPKPMTEEEHLKSCNTEQLADVFFEYRYINATPQQQLWLSANEDFVKGGIVEWLKQPHKDGET